MKYILPLFALFILFNYSCRPSDDFNTDSSIVLEFSLDTLHFDTVFTELGSATRILKVYNRDDKAIKISKISIKDHPNSFFRINVDGIAGNVATDIEIAGNDSLYIFGEVTIDPDQPLSLSPFVIEDYLVFEINGNTQELLMEAWGQNANYFPDRFNKGELFEKTCTQDFIITNEKPWVFYGTVIFTGCNVIVEEGARIHVHGGIVAEFDQDNMKFFRNDGRIVLWEGSTLTVNGTQENPVIISGDRLEESFDEVPGQWFGILLFGKNTTHHIQHMELKNSIVGIYVDSMVNLNIENSKIYNTSNGGIIATHATINATNCLFYGSGSNAVQITNGGDYNFTYCTLASYGGESPALYMSNLKCGSDDPFGCSPCFEYRLKAHFKNSIIFGSKKDEISLVDGDDCNEGVSNPMNYTFENCIVRVDELVNNPNDQTFSDFFDYCNPCQNADNNDAVFLAPNEDDYHLDTLSIAENKAEAVSGFPFDLEGNMRGTDTASGNENSPDEGCYEYQY